ncbi:galactose mutarotase-like protein [Atractiella rhizophila]|nr:galactose mutarotase-like protein [Atractiella rhizophila]
MAPQINDTSFNPVSLSSSSLSFSVLPFGLTFYSFQLRQNGNETELLIGPQKPEEHAQVRRFRNQTVGRYANRLPAGEWTACDGSTKLNLDVVEPPSVCLHGGQSSLDQRTWTALPLESTSLFPSVPKENALLFQLQSPDGDNGFPGDLLVQVLMTLDGNKFKYVIKAALEGDAPATPVNLTVHWGFNFGGDHTAKDYAMWAECDKVVVVNSSDALPTGELGDVKGTIFDFNQGGPEDLKGIRKFGDVWDEENGVDHCLVFANPSSTSPKLILVGPSSSTPRPVLTFTSNQPAVQCYTAKFFDGDGTRRASHSSSTDGKGGYEKFQATFLEFQGVIGACLPGKEFDTLREKNGGDSILKKGEVYENWVEVEVGTI